MVITSCISTMVPNPNLSEGKSIVDRPRLWQIEARFINFDLKHLDWKKKFNKISLISNYLTILYFEHL